MKISYVVKNICWFVKLVLFFICIYDGSQYKMFLLWAIPKSLKNARLEIKPP